MKELALKIEGIGEIPVPTGIAHIVANPFGQNIIQTATSVLIFSAIILSLIFFVIGGIMWVTSEGNKEKIQSARNTLTYAIVGLIVVFFAFLIVNIIQYFFGVL